MIGPEAILEQRQREIDEALAELEPRIDAHLKQRFDGGSVDFELEPNEELPPHVVRAVREKYKSGDDPWRVVDYSAPTAQCLGGFVFSAVLPDRD